jgi:hypothetical protein
MRIEMSPQERVFYRTVDEVGQKSMPWQVLNEKNAENTVSLLTNFFEGKKVFCLRIDEETKKEEFLRELPILGGKAIETQVQFLSDPTRLANNFISVKFAGSDTKNPYEIKISEGQNFCFSKRNATPILILRQFMFPGFEAAVRAGDTGDISSGRWKQEFYVGIPL